MDKLTIDNTLLRPQLGDGWGLNTSQEPACIQNRDAGIGFEVNDISLMILELCDGVQSVASIIDHLCLRFPEAKQSIGDDVELVLRNLHESDALIFVPAQSLELFDIPEKTPLHAKKKLCIGMATYDDYDGVYFSLQAIRLYHPEVLDKVEFIVIDNHPDGPCAKSLKEFEHWVPNYRYVPCDTIRGTAVRDFIFREANAEFVLCIDSHVFIEAGVIERLLTYFDAHPETKDLLQGPLLNDDMRNYSTHFVPVWNSGMYGTWGTDARADDADNEAFDIPMQGLGLFACARSAWPGFNPRFSGFGGEEGYIHEKFRQAGGRTLCLPFLRWLHRFNRPMGTRYSVKWEDRVRNYLIGWDELGREADDVIEHFSEHIGEKNTQDIVSAVTAELENPFYYFDAIYYLVDEHKLEASGEMQQAFARYGISSRVIAIYLSDYSDEANVARIIASRDIILTARDGGYDNVIIIDSSSALNIIIDDIFQRAVAELDQYDWSVFYPDQRPVGGGENHHQALVDLSHREIKNVTCFAFHHRVFSQLLMDLPEHEDVAVNWLKSTENLGVYCAENISSRVGLAPA